MPTTYANKATKVYSGSYSIASNLNAVNLATEFAELEATRYGDTCHYSVPGLAKVTFDYAGLSAADGTSAIDDIIEAQKTTVNNPLTVCPYTGAAGEVAYFTKTMTLNLTPMQGSVGELWNFNVSGVGQGQKLIRGKIMATGSKTSTAAGTAYQLGAVGATQYLYGCLHVYAASGTNPTLDVIVESDNAEGFSSGVTKLTFTQATGITSQFITPVAGAISDDWWRASWTIGGTDTPTFGFIISVGIL